MDRCEAAGLTVAALSPQGKVDPAKKNFGGGNTAWEEKTLSKYEFRWAPCSDWPSAHLWGLACPWERLQAQSPVLAWGQRVGLRLAPGCRLTLQGADTGVFSKHKWGWLPAQPRAPAHCQASLGGPHT